MLHPRWLKHTGIKGMGSVFIFLVIYLWFPPWNIRLCWISGEMGELEVNWYECTFTGSTEPERTSVCVCVCVRACVCMCVCACALSHSVMSNSLQPHRLIQPAWSKLCDGLDIIKAQTPCREARGGLYCGLHHILATSPLTSATAQSLLSLH